MPCNAQSSNQSSSDLVKQIPVLNLERLPYLRRVLNSIFNHLSLLPKLQIDLFLIIISLDVGDIDGNQNICGLFFEPDEA
jgi:hypothetical protein